MNKLGLCFCTFILIFGITTFTLFYQSSDELEECYQIGIHREVIYDIKLLLTISIYSTFLLTVFTFLDLFKKSESLIFDTMQGTLIALNVSTGLILFITNTIPNSYLHICSIKIIVIVVLTSLIVEIAFMVLCLLGVIIILNAILVFLEKIKKCMCNPLKILNLRRICTFILTSWLFALSWSLITYGSTMLINFMGTFQIFSTIILLISFNYYQDKVIYYLVLVNIFGIIVFLLENVQQRKITPYGIISFSSIGFYPIYMIFYKVKKKFVNRIRTGHFEMPAEPPAVYASGEIELYNF